LHGLSPKSDDPFFLSFYGKALKIGRCVSKFFQSEMELMISINKIRALVETEAEENFLQNKLTFQEREAIRAVNGHSSRITRDYYNYSRGNNEANCAMRGFAKIFSNRSDGNSGLEEARLSQEQSACNTIDGESGALNDLVIQPIQNHDILDREETNHQPYDGTFRSHLLNGQKVGGKWTAHVYEKSNIPIDAMWGTEHIDYDKAGKASWSMEEILYIQDWFHSNRYMEGQKCAALLKHIRSDKNAMPIFHQRHILKTDRLRAGIIALRKYEELTLSEDQRF
jgi:hypothetical protein